METVNSLFNKYSMAMSELKDHRTEDWFMMSSPWPTLTAVGLYLLMVSGGMKLMTSRPALDLKGALIAYNTVMVLVSLYLFVEFVLSAWIRPGFSLFCEPVDYSNDPMSLRLANVCYWFYFSKIIELLDTVFFVLRKKNNQISFLHVYHHSTMPILWWAGVRYVAGGESYFSATINSWIHVMMYLYYLLSAMGPSMRKYLWWKKYMTRMQLMQFWLILLHTSYSIYVDCGYPRSYNVALIVYMISHIILFSNFYYHSYLKVSRRLSLHLQSDKAMLSSNGIVANGTANGDVRKRKE